MIPEEDFEEVAIEEEPAASSSVPVLSTPKVAKTKLQPTSKIAKATLAPTPKISKATSTSSPTIPKATGKVGRSPRLRGWGEIKQRLAPQPHLLHPVHQEQIPLHHYQKARPEVCEPKGPPPKSALARRNVREPQGPPPCISMGQGLCRPGHIYKGAHPCNTAEAVQASVLALDYH